jgi:hypothetical protein
MNGAALKDEFGGDMLLAYTSNINGSILAGRLHLQSNALRRHIERGKATLAQTHKAIGI